MTQLLNTLWNDDVAAVLSAEVVLILSIAVLAVLVGLSEVAVAVNTELNDISNAIGALDQTYFLPGFNASIDGEKQKAQVFGTVFTDDGDDCDNNDSCDLVVPTPPAQNETTN